MARLKIISGSVPPAGLARQIEEPVMDDVAMNLIRDYLAAVDDAISRVQQHIGPDLVRQGPGGGRFPRFGVLADGSEYQFHGIGCTVSDGDIAVKFDFAKNGRYDGFDVWHLWYFVTQRPESYPAFTDRPSVEISLRRLLDENKIFPEDGHREIYFLVGSPPSFL